MRKHLNGPLALFTLLFTITAGIALYGGGAGGQAPTTPAPLSYKTNPSDPALKDDLQRSLRINTYRVVADSGPARGETIYYYKCWMCHNKYTISSNVGAAPYLQDLFKHATLATGEPVNDTTVAALIKNGTPRMPSFVAALSDSDIADLLGYLKGGKCCLEGETPPPNPWYKASTTPWSVPTSVSGGPTGVVTSTAGSGDSMEGIKVQLIAPNGVRTTVYTNEAGQYEFPKMQTGQYILRIATPLEYKPYRRDGVRIDGATKLPDTVLDPVTKLEPLANRQMPEARLAATIETQSQLSNAELLWNLPGTAEDKDRFRRGCGSGCHSYVPMFRVRYDERSWGLIVDRMFNYGGATLRNRGAGDPEGGSGRGSKDDQQKLVKWLAQVRGPGVVDAPYQTFPRPRGPSTRAVITEYEIPRELMSLHDVSGDSQGNIWFTSHKSRVFGKLDPRTGVVKEYLLPLKENAVPGNHRVLVDQEHGDVVWLTEPWGRRITKFEPHTETMKHFPYPAAFDNNFAVTPDGFLWGNGNERGRPGTTLSKMDPETGEVVARYTIRESYDNTVSPDGSFWAGGGPSTGGNYGQFVDLKTGKTIILDTGTRMAGPSRGGWDPFGNAWFGGKNGSFIRLDSKTLRMREFFTPIFTPYSDFYEAMPDKNGEVWGGLLHGRGFMRYNPKTDRWVEYALPEPFGHDRRTWIDNSTNPVTIWYPDYQGYIVRIQPLD